jgi:hypothetical protein
MICIRLFRKYKLPRHDIIRDRGHASEIIVKLGFEHFFFFFGDEIKPFLESKFPFPVAQFLHCDHVARGISTTGVKAYHPFARIQGKSLKIRNSVIFKPSQFFVRKAYFGVICIWKYDILVNLFIFCKSFASPFHSIAVKGSQRALLFMAVSLQNPQVRAAFLNSLSFKYWKMKKRISGGNLNLFMRYRFSIFIVFLQIN